MSEAKIQFHGKPGTIPQDLCRAKNITAEAKTIFALLTTYKEAYPGQVWLADHVPCSEPTVRSRLRELELHGWLLRVRRNRRANETDLYHVYLSKPLPLSKRAEWVRELGFGESEIRALPKGDYGKEITVKRLPKRAFPKRVEGSAGLKSSDGETPHSSAARTYPPEWYRQNETDYQTIKGVTLTGPEFSPLQRDLKLIYKAGHMPADVKALMDALEASPEAWTDGWTIKTVRMKLAEWKGGKLKLSSNGDRPKRPGTSRGKEYYLREEAVCGGRNDPQ